MRRAFSGRRLQRDLSPNVGHVQLTRACDELVDLLPSRLDDAGVRRRNRLRTWESRLQTVISRYEKEGAGDDRQARVSALRATRLDDKLGVDPEVQGLLKRVGG